MNMQLTTYSYAEDVATKKSVLLYFDERDKFCGFLFDVPKPGDWEDYPKPLIDFAKLENQLGITPSENRFVRIDRVAFELLRSYVIGKALPNDHETGIERHFREADALVS
jgi:hypothetical protein